MAAPFVPSRSRPMVDCWQPHTHALRSSGACRIAPWIRSNNQPQRRFFRSNPVLSCRTLAGVILIVVVSPVSAQSTDPKAIEFFEKKIRPVLVQHCYECHSAGSSKVKGGLLLDTRDGIRKGGKSGPAVVPGKLQDSLLI